MTSQMQDIAMARPIASYPKISVGKRHATVKVYAAYAMLSDAVDYGI